eukprot:TRINITY_DN91016_c0_g1_i1.p1 TRINITY_DN91016_c0_g1~~TRINITY_DN91016_c0_g1_i1.p1  ORF type:complete len:184 (-),score=40.82 TRINITY_DN91016_c0_g1_i1:334-885(-)
MAPNTSARNASPAPRAAKKIEGSKENENQNLIQDEHEQPSNILKTSLKENVSQNLMQNENDQDTQKQGKPMALTSKARSTVRATGRSLGSLCRSSCALVRGTFQRGKASVVHAISGISLRSKVSLVAVLVMLITLMAFLIVYSTDFVGEFAACMWKVTSQAWNDASQHLAGLACKRSEASADL